jgi:hypothetical protein
MCFGELPNTSHPRIQLQVSQAAGAAAIEVSAIAPPKARETHRMKANNRRMRPPSGASALHSRDYGMLGANGDAVSLAGPSAYDVSFFESRPAAVLFFLKKLTRNIRGAFVSGCRHMPTRLGLTA